MRNVLSFRRAIVFVCLVLAAVALYFLTSSRPQSAQVRTPEPFAQYKKFAERDSLTDEIRSRSKELIRVEIRDEVDRSAAARLGSMVQDFGTFAILAKEKTAKLSESGLEGQKIGSKIHLPGASFDPISSPPADSALGRTKLASPEKDYYIVQFGGIATDEWLNSIRDAGVEILQYVPDQAFLVYGDGAAISRVAAHSRVRWVGAYAAEQRIPEDVKQRAALAKLKARNAKSKATAGETDIFNVSVFSRANLKAVEAAVSQEITGRVTGRLALSNSFFNLIRVELPVAEVDKLASVPEVIRIDSYVSPTAEDEKSSQIIAGNYTSPTMVQGPGYNPSFQFAADGNGVTVMVSDDGISIPGNGGFYLTGGNTVDGPLRGSTAGASTGHGHLNASIIAGNSPFGAVDPLGYNYGLGVAPRANIVNIPWLKFGYILNAEADARAIDDAFNTAGPNGVRASISNHSWGEGVNGNTYGDREMLYDRLVQDGSIGGGIDPFTIVFSAGNCGLAPANDQCIPKGGSSSQNGLTQPKVAKNIITVGSSENLRSELAGGLVSADNIEDLAASSSRGPAADGRIKPDIIAPGAVITGSRAGLSCTGVVSCFDANHSWSNGTSHAAPQVAGAAAIFTEFWKKSHDGVNPSPALIKAAILSSGQEMGGANVSASTVPNGNEGWGRINMKYMIDRAALTERIDQTVPFLDVGQTYTLNGSVNDPTRPVRVALVWTDPPALSDPALVNNLNLTVTVGGNTYRGNVFSGGVSTPGGAFDNVNNVEQVWLPAGIPNGTQFSITVSAAALNGDGILENGDNSDQNFALVAYNYSPVPPVSYYTVTGQLVSQSGRGVPKAVVSMVGPDGIARMTTTNPFGYFRFGNVASGRTYTIFVSNKKTTFNPQMITVNSDINSLILTSVAGGP
jgi:hypothetical protein